MALSPKFAGARLLLSSKTSPTTDSINTVEVFLDYVCPFSAKLFNTLYTSVVPAVKADAQLAPKVQFIFRQVVQPWHPSSTLVHEAGIAILRLAPTKFWDFSAALFRDQKTYFDVSVINETRNQTYRRLAKLGATAAGVDEGKLYDLLAVSSQAADDGSLNIGNAVTNDLKVAVKTTRLLGVHVTPTVHLNGWPASEISSSWTAEQWLEWLGKSLS